MKLCLKDLWACGERAPSGALDVLHLFALEKVLDRQGVLQLLAGLADGPVHLLQRAIGNSGDLFGAETFDCIKNEDLTVGAPRIAGAVAVAWRLGPLPEPERLLDYAILGITVILVIATLFTKGSAPR